LAICHGELDGLANRTEHGNAFLGKSGVLKGIVGSRAYRFLSAFPL
jgi:hypothetical protein